MEQLVDIVHFLHMEIHNAFGTAGMYVSSFTIRLESMKLCYKLCIYVVCKECLLCADTQKPVKSNRQKLGAAGLALHYANIITQIDTLVSQFYRYYY